jgi:hypothetical protein
MTTVNCALCGDVIVKPERADRLVLAYERPRAGGGDNALRLRQPQQTWAHPACVNMEAKKVSAVQGRLL